jgi:hypothetical protein
MARKLGQEYFDAHVVEYQIASDLPDSAVQEATAEDSPDSASAM